MTETATSAVLRAALDAARAHDKPKARRYLVQATQMDPRNEAAWQWLAGVAESPVEAAAALEKVLALNPANEKARTALRQVRLTAGVAAAKTKDGPTARRLLRAVVADDPRSENAWLWLASVAESSAEALANLDRVLAINPENPAARRGIDYYLKKLRKSEPLPDAAPPPVAPVPVPAPAAPRPKPAGPRLAEPPIDAGPTVLVVEDSPTVRKLAALTLGRAGYRVAEAADGREAVNRIRDHGPPALILLDVTMPGMDGYEFCRLVRSDPDTKKVPVVMLTGKDGFFDKLRGRMAGTDLYLTKPLQPDALLAAVRKYCPTTP